MSKEILTFGDIETEKKVYHHKSTVLLRDIDTENVLVSNKVSSGEKNYKYFIGYHKVKPLHIILPKTSACVKNYDGQTTKWMYFLMEMMIY